MGKPNVPFLESLVKSQFASIAATTVDFLSFAFLTDIIHIYYLISTAISSFIGACVSFFLGRHWAFRKADEGVWGQAFRYALSSATILASNVGGMYLFTDVFGVHHLLSKIIVSIIVGVCISFPLFRYFVYK